MGRCGENREFRRRADRRSAAAAFSLLAMLVLADPVVHADDRADGTVPVSPLNGAAVAPAFVAAGAAFNAVIRPRANPWVQPKTDPRLREKIAAAARLAALRIEEIPECAEMFSALGADGIDVLQSTLYFPINHPIRRVDFCPMNMAYTFVGGPATWLCPDFKRLPTERAALILIHEALHHAGLSEHPVDPDGMTSPAINKMVKRRCGF